MQARIAGSRSDKEGATIDWHSKILKVQWSIKHYVNLVHLEVCLERQILFF